MKIYKPFRSIPVLKHEDLNDKYIPYVFANNLFTEEELAKILSLWHDDKAIEGRIGPTNILSYEKRKAKEIHITEQGNEWLYDKITMAVIMANASKFKFDITGFHAPLRLIQYEKDDFFDWHTDYGPSTVSNRKIAVSIQLSDPSEYEGGDLQLMTDKIIAPKEKGSVVIFPTYTLHRVLPIISGCRKSIVAQISGPPFK